MQKSEVHIFMRRLNVFCSDIRWNFLEVLVMMMMMMTRDGDDDEYRYLCETDIDIDVRQKKNSLSAQYLLNSYFPLYLRFLY